ncbi:MAG: alpha/beta fold hydrolase [Chthoniobacterales bacterium]
MKGTTTIILDGLAGRHLRWGGLQRKVEKAIGPAEIWEYRNHGRAGLDEEGQKLAEYLAALNKPFHVIGYSMGGLVIREAMRRSPDLPLLRAAFLNVPHGGSQFARLLPFAAMRQMRPQSEFLSTLDAAPWPYPTFVSWCPGDLVVFPGASARWKNAHQIHRCDIPAHIWPVFSPSIHRQIVQFLQKE